MMRGRSMKNAIGVLLGIGLLLPGGASALARAPARYEGMVIQYTGEADKPASRVIISVTHRDADSLRQATNVRGKFDMFYRIDVVDPVTLARLKSIVRRDRAGALQRSRSTAGHESTIKVTMVDDRRLRAHAFNAASSMKLLDALSDESRLYPGLTEDIHALAVRIRKAKGMNCNIRGQVHFFVS